MGIIYLAYNKINGKFYIGKTTKSLEFRRQEHSYSLKDNTPFHNAIKKYGMDSFIWEVLLTSPNENELNQMEIFCIQELNTKVPYGYNLANGGQGASGMVVKDSVKQHLREKAIQQWNNPILKTRHKEAMQKWGQELTLEMRETLSRNGKLNKGIPKPEGFGKKVREWMVGRESNFKNKHHSLEAREKIRLAMVERKKQEKRRKLKWEENLVSQEVSQKS